MGKFMERFGRLAIALAIGFVAITVQQASGEPENFTVTEEEEKIAVGSATSVMLLGSISFMMTLFYLVNHPDDDMKKYSWMVISNTISIFSAVLLFQAVNNLVEEYVIGSLCGEESTRESGSGAACEVTVDITHFVIWLTLLQIVLAVTSGAVYEVWAVQLIMGDEEPNIRESEFDIKSWSVLFAHLTGFASINAWGSVQQKYLNDSAGNAFLAVPIGVVALLLLLQVYDMIREHIAMGDDGEKDEFETLWDKEAEEAENDVAGLSMSFLVVQVIRFHISSHLPDQEGADDENASPGFFYGTLFMYALLFTGMSVVTLKINEKVDEEKEKLKRILEVLNAFWTCGTSWCFFYSCQWAFVSWDFVSEESVMKVAMALFLSFTSFTFIFFLDVLEDHKVFGDDADEAIEKVIEALGLLVGFSWEQSFDSALDTITDATKTSMNPNITRLLLSIVLVLIVFPAWRHYILPTAQELSAGEGVAERMKYAEMYSKKFVEKSTPELELDNHHLVLKRMRRKTLEEVKKKGEGGEAPKEPPKNKRLTHLSVTAAGIKEIADPHADGMLEALLSSNKKSKNDSDDD